MTAAEVIALLGFLDEMFQLGGKLVEAALQQKPQLQLDSLPNLSKTEQSRIDALSRIQENK